MACIANKPIVDGIETNVKGRAQVIRLDIQSDIGQLYAARFNARSTPTFVMLDAKGEVAWLTTGRIDPQKVYDLINH